MRIRMVLSCLVTIHLVSAQRTILDNFTLTFRSLVQVFLGNTATPQGLIAAGKLNKLQRYIPNDAPFPCDVSSGRSAERPSSVHQLRPGDIDVIAAMGDSLTAANGAAAVRTYDVIIENRGLSWSIGGQGTWREHLTLPNIFKAFNPQLFGFSLNDSFSHQRPAQFNVAEAGAMSRDMPYMAKILVKRIRADKRVDLENDWKLVTFMIGGNDFCADLCYYKDPTLAPEIHRRDLFQALDYLRDNLPRTFVNLVLPPNIKIIIDFKRKIQFCQASHIVVCPCLFGKHRLIARNKMVKIMRRWQQVEEEVSLSPRYRGREDFTVVMQPFVADLTFPDRPAKDGKGNETDISYMSEDCFHFSPKGYARAANALWNNMMEPVGQKSLNWRDEFSKFNCPTPKHPFLFTYKNSGPTVGTMQIV